MSTGTRVRFVLEGLSRAGGIRVITSVANHLTSRGYEVELLVPDYASSPAYPLDPQVRVRPLRTHGPPIVRRVTYQLRLLKASACATDFCVLPRHRTAFIALASTVLNGRTKTIRLIYLVQHLAPLSESRLPKPLATAIVRIGYRLPVTYVAVSTWLKSQAQLPEESTVIPNGIDTNVFAPTRDIGAECARPTVGAIVRNGTIKGPDILAATLRCLQDLDGEIALHLAVPPNEQADLPAWRIRRVSRPSSDTEMARFYNSLSTFIFTSRREGFGLPPLEAMACGVPVVSTKCGAVPEFGKPPAVVTVDPDPVQIASAVRSALLDPARREYCRGTGTSHARAYSHEAMVRGYESLLGALSDQGSHVSVWGIARRHGADWLGGLVRRVIRRTRTSLHALRTSGSTSSKGHL